MKTPGHAYLLQGKDQGHVEKIIPERLFLFFLSLFFEGMDILEGLMENLLEQLCQDGYKDVIYGVSNHKKLTPKHIVVFPVQLTFLFLVKLYTR